eukprot:CAMPEP_0174879064 /NCGR_PEP_ID=MMETSP1114-20130205/83074_1 /TAXON_ID=312471 /ORGANISM="Neobodo designis, Strain CCAP 1951/1" /LENGTH=369 /DNA_ID=CAMNT_0016114455 /DNA_START=70 /DNA_END=1175 /DNA_ORIENTATION=+
MKLHRVVSFITIALATVCASVSAGTAPHVAWRVARPNTTSDPYNSGVAYGAGNVFIGYCTDAGVGFAAYDAVTGAMKWSNSNLLDEHYACEYPPLYKPLYNGGTVYAIGSYSAVAFDASTGAVLWTQTSNLNNDAGVVAFDSLNGNIVFPGINNVVSALDASTGAIRWQYTLRDWEPVGDPASIAVAYNHVYIPNYNGTIAALRADTGALDWAVNVTRGVGEFGPVATVCGVLVVSDYTYSQVYGLDPATGAKQWTLSVDTNLPAPVVDEDSCMAYFTTLNGAAAIAVLPGTATWVVTNGNSSYSMAAVAGGRFWEVSYNVQGVPAAVVVRNATTGVVAGTLPLNVGAATGDASSVTATSTDGSMFFFV